MAERTHTKIAFAPPTDCALAEVKVYAPDGTLLRTIAPAALRQRPCPVPAQHAIAIPPRVERPARYGRARRWSAT